MNILSHDLAKKVFIIAEIGANHEGNVDHAKKMILAAKESGADAVKFQTYVPENLVASSETARRKHFKKLALSQDQFRSLNQFAAEHEILFMSTPFDPDSVLFLNDLNVPAFKIASGDLTCHPLLKKVVQTGKPVIVSTGLATIDEIRQAYQYMSDVDKTVSGRLAFLHCVTSYPTNHMEANLGMIKKLQSIFPDVTVGYSDHSLDISDCFVAVAWGARIIEKHFTLDKQFSDFRDHQLSATPDELKSLVDTVRQIEHYMVPVKDISDCEEANFVPFRRSLAAKTPLKAGDVLTEQTLTYLRPQVGIPAQEYDNYLGKMVTKPAKTGEILTYDHFK